MKLRLAKVSDLPIIMNIIYDAKSFLKEQGINQWQNNYPNDNVVLQDIQNQNCYVVSLQDKIIGTFALSFDGDSDYEAIYNGGWRKNEQFSVIHRVAVDKQYAGLGIASKMMEYAEGLSKLRHINYVRIDTHRDNILMQKVLNKNDFVFCGLINIADGSSRIVFDKIF